MLTAMDAVFQYELPSLHPLAVHFPLVLLLTAAFGAFVWTFAGTPFWRRLTLLLTTFGTAGCIAAYITGQRLLDESEGVPIVEELGGLHEDMALFTLLTSCAALLVLGAMSVDAERRRTERDNLLSRIAAACLIFIAAALVAWTAHIGATMTWGVPGS